MAISHTIRAEDTLESIARQYDVARNSILAANPGIDPSRLPLGNSIVVPVSKETRIVQTFANYNYDKFISQLDALHERYPFLEMESIGQSVLGKTIPAVQIGTGSLQVHFNGAVHANEWITSILLMKFVEEFASAYHDAGTCCGCDAKALFANATLWVVPMVNPDGVDLVQNEFSNEHPLYPQLVEWNEGSHQFEHWKANIRGVDLNDQFPARWETEKERRNVPGPAPRDYAGASPLSEPEAAALAEFTLEHNFDRVLSFHTQGEEIYWNYHDYEPPEAKILAERMAQTSGYRSVRLEGSDAGYKDWFIQHFHRPGFTIEAGSGENPLPVSQCESIYGAVKKIMLEGLLKK